MSIQRVARLALPIFAFALATPSLVAQDAPAAPPTVPGARDINRITAGTYRTDPAHTLVGWKVSHFGFNDYFGQFGDVSGTLTLDPANPARASVDITVPVSGLSTASSGLTAHMQRADFFDQANHPTVRFVSTAVEVTQDRIVIAGNLTIRGTTRPVILSTRFVGAGTNPYNRKDTIGFHATTTIRRSDFGMSYAVPLVSDDVELTISAAFEKQG
jgi:polyisoprenoid-binding protein YceI